MLLHVFRNYLINSIPVTIQSKLNILTYYLLKFKYNWNEHTWNNNMNIRISHTKIWLGTIIWARSRFSLFFYFSLTHEPLSLKILPPKTFWNPSNLKWSKPTLSLFGCKSWWGVWVSFRLFWGSGSREKILWIRE